MFQLSNPTSSSLPNEKRRLSRELALKLMFQYQANSLTPEEIVYLFEQNFGPKNDYDSGLELTADRFEEAWPLAKELFLGATGCLEELDQDIDQAANNWSLDRMSQVDLALLRLAYFEMRFREDIPLVVSLNEAIEIAKSFGADDSASFINGILDKLLSKGGVKRKNSKKSSKNT
ncbi:MAG: transcription antitermination factor NusB [Deltaproteobacteria bacterium]|nr:transcription antitermination factor NusB [Deltaproteobacteria bacterium]